MTPRLLGGGLDENDDRDRSVLETAVQVGYQLVGDTIVFLRGTYNERDYDLDTPAVAVNRDSDGYEIVAGLHLSWGALLPVRYLPGIRNNPSMIPVSHQFRAWPMARRLIGMLRRSRPFALAQIQRSKTQRLVVRRLFKGKHLALGWTMSSSVISLPV